MRELAEVIEGFGSRTLAAGIQAGILGLLIGEGGSRRMPWDAGRAVLFECSQGAAGAADEKVLRRSCLKK